LRRISPRLRHAALVAAKGNTRQDADDGDHNHQLYEGEAALAGGAQVGRHGCAHFTISRQEIRREDLVLPWVRIDQLAELYLAAKAAGFARANVHLLTDMIACPGGDYCALANARSLPIAAAITERYQDLDELFDLGEIDLHMSGCINSCGHHHSGHIGILGVDKDGQEWYQVTLGGSDGSFLSGPAKAGKVVGPSFAAAEVVDVVEAVLDVYRDKRETHETFARTLNRVGFDVFKAAANSARNTTARAN
jgi:sulfite reductase (NADPH) hemoprotein beta-component